MSDDPVERNRAAPRRGPPAGRDPTGWRATRRVLALTAATVLAATAVLVVVALS